MASLKQQRGFSIPMAIFVMVVLAMLGAAMARIVAQGQESVAREVVSIRALMAAESGAERGLHQVLTVDGSGCAAGLPNFSQLFGGVWNLTIPGLQNCNADISCSVTNVDTDFDGTPDPHYTVRSVGRCGPSGSQAVRIVEVQAR